MALVWYDIYEDKIIESETLDMFFYHGYLFDTNPLSYLWGEYFELLGEL